MLVSKSCQMPKLKCGEMSVRRTHKPLAMVQLQTTMYSNAHLGRIHSWELLCLADLIACSFLCPPSGPQLFASNQR